MRKIILLLFALFLYGFNYSKIETNIVTTSKYHAIIDKQIKAGITGYVIHNNMVIAKAISNGKLNVSYLPFIKLKNSALATPKLTPQKGDKIIFGLYNHRWLLIAPNQKIYLNTIKNYPNVTFINSDIFANYFESKPEKKDFQKFCKDFNVGIIDFILDNEYIVDCESFVVLDKKNTTNQKYTKPFFTNYEKFNTSLFSSIPENWINYYKTLFKKGK